MLIWKCFFWIDHIDNEYYVTGMGNIFTVLTEIYSVTSSNLKPCVLNCQGKNGPTQNWSPGPILSIKIGPLDHFCPSNPVLGGPTLVVKIGPTQTKVVLPGRLLPCKLGPTSGPFLPRENGPIPGRQCNQHFWHKIYSRRIFHRPFVSK